jgi:predicted dehydrogenase
MSSHGARVVSGTLAEGPTAQRATGESRTPRIPVGIVGCGHVSFQYFEGCREFDLLDVVACADIEPERARAKAKEYGVPTACTPEQLLDDPDVQIVVNLTPPRYHAETTLGAIERGKHVYSEKPLGIRPEEGLAILDAAAVRGVRVGCAPDTFLGGGLQTCRKLIDDGWIGEPVAAVAFVTSHGYEGWHPNVEFFYQRGGGPMLDVGPYYATALVSLLGPIRRVTGSTKATFPERRIPTGAHAGTTVPVETSTHVAGVLDFASGAVATMMASYDVWATRLPYIEIYGTEGSLSVPDPDCFGGVPRIRRPGPEESQENPPPPGTLPWTDLPLTHSADVGRGIGVADLAYGIVYGRPHRASAELACHVLDVLCAFEDASTAGAHVEIQSTCERPAPLPLGLARGRLDP